MAEETRTHEGCQGGVMVRSHENEVGVEWRCLHCDAKESELKQPKPAVKGVKT